MRLPKETERRYIRRILESRLRILCNQGFYGSLLMHMNFTLDEEVKNVASDRRRIYFNPEFLDRISDQELDFALIHEVVHLSLKHNSRCREFEYRKTYDDAADIVANSNILKSFDMDEESIRIGSEIQFHQAPDGREGHEFSVEELYGILCEDAIRTKGLGFQYEVDENGITTAFADTESDGFDDHSRWDRDSDEEVTDREWEKYTMDACEMIYIRDPSNSRGLIPRYAARAYQELKQGTTDWRILLNNFIQEEFHDYSFTPPDRRYSESPFFLPDFNDQEENTRKVLFMIDTSGSMSDEEITAAYSEVKGALEQFNGRLEGWLGFFDAAIVEPQPFKNEEELKVIHPYGGGGTSFSIIFAYVRDRMEDEKISSIVILTDGCAPWPEEEAAMGIPVIWLINNEQVTPPWGKVARITGERKKFEAK